MGDEGVLKGLEAEGVEGVVKGGEGREKDEAEVNED